MVYNLGLLPVDNGRIGSTSAVVLMSNLKKLTEAQQLLHCAYTYLHFVDDYSLFAWSLMMDCSERSQIESDFLIRVDLFIL